MTKISEHCGLASYASFAAQTRGRRHPEPAAPTRDDFQRDRDRIVHCTAFRRLVYKTQVFLNHEGDLFRTRMTHSLEVAQLSRSLARALRLNEDLVETIALAHDLGHTPFRHGHGATTAHLKRGVEEAACVTVGHPSAVHTLTLPPLWGCAWLLVSPSPRPAELCSRPRP